MADLARYCADRLLADNYQSRKGNRLLMRPPRYDLSIKIVSANAGRVRLHAVQFAVFIDIALRRCVAAAKWEETSSSDREPIFLEQRYSIT